jgi:Zn-dependent M32 family carboxypeptidase
MTRKFEMVDDNLHVTVELSDDVFIPINGERTNIGVFSQTTKQVIPKENIKKLIDFVKSEKENGEKQLKQLEEQYKPIMDLEEIGEDILKHCRVAIDKGTKSFKTEMKVLAKRINDLDRKKSLYQQIEYVKKILEDVNSDLDNLTELTK